MQRRLLLFLAGHLLFLSSALSQPHAKHDHGVCGTHHPEDLALLTQRLLANRAVAGTDPVQPRSTLYVPVKFHLVARTDGTGGPSVHDVLNQLCLMNQDFADTDMRFYIRNGFSFINNTTMYDNHSATTSVMQFVRANNAINIYVVNDATPSSGGLGTVLGYYSPNRDWIVVRRNQVNGGSNSASATLPHEVGHFFSLLHPHNGWDSEPYDQAMHGNPVQAVSPDGIPTERQNGTNCANAGDFLCDTPPDYNFGFGWPNCNYNAGTLDPQGNLVNPDEKLMMGYFLNCPRPEYYFSAQQRSIMRADFNSAQRLYIRYNYMPNDAPITQAPTLISPVGGTMQAGYNAITFEWASVANADSYVLEISRTASFVLNPLRYVVNGTSRVVNDLEPNRTYFWRVRPFNEGFHCQIFSVNGSFSTGSDVLDTTAPSFVTTWAVSPNPVQSGQELTLQLSTSANFTAQMALYSLTGQQLYNVAAQPFSIGENRVRIPVAGLPAGAYLLVLQAPEGRLQQRVLVMR